MTQKEKLARMQMYAQRIGIIARNINEEGNDYDQSWHKKYVTDLVELQKEVLDILKKK